ncbi:MAG: hypothetical protein HN737_07745 [Desulfobacterales bacterium]|jgi:hypothetical protein|nr:hypothetical protein [Desulfobacteraceae bacterium]MBT7085864.1 hypothetical protein [Desulfobacterales bacterium]MBT7697288.1 hypothetical protein [Desulfobacterales bacterium]
MAAKKGSAKRRKWKRYESRWVMTVVFEKSSLLNFGKTSFIKLGPVVDISMNGLAVQYIGDKKRNDKTSVLSVLGPDEEILLDSIPYTIVSEDHSVELPDLKKIWNRTVQFGNLTPVHKFQLKQLIEKFTKELNVERRAGADRRQFDDPQYDEDSEWVIKKSRRKKNRRRKL